MRQMVQHLCTSNEHAGDNEDGWWWLTLSRPFGERDADTLGMGGRERKGTRVWWRMLGGTLRQRNKWDTRREREGMEETP
jgi:hypothetical protein